MKKFKKLIALTVVALSVGGAGFAVAKTVSAQTFYFQTSASGWSQPAPYPISDDWWRGWSGPSGHAWYPHYYSKYWAHPDYWGSMAQVGTSGWTSYDWGAAEADSLIMGWGSYQAATYFYN